MTSEDRSRYMGPGGRVAASAHSAAFGHYADVDFDVIGESMGGSNSRSDGVEGLQGRGDMVQGSGNGGRSGARDAARDAAVQMTAAQRQHGGSFGGQRMWGDGSGMPVMGQMPGMSSGRGHDSIGESAWDAASGNSGGGAAPVSYPGVSMGPASPGAPTLMFFATPSHNMTSTTPLTMGDSAGGGTGVASGAVMGQARAVTAAFTTLLGGGSGSGSGSTIKPPGKNDTTPREDQDGGGGPVVLSRADGRAQGSMINRGLGRRVPGDGRGDRDTTGGSTSGATMTRNQQAGGERANDASGGTVDWDTALAINRLVNPGSE